VDKSWQAQNVVILLILQTGFGTHVAFIWFCNQHICSIQLYSLVHFAILQLFTANESVVLHIQRKQASFLQYKVDAWEKAASKYFPIYIYMLKKGEKRVEKKCSLQRNITQLSQSLYAATYDLPTPPGSWHREETATTR